MQVTPQALEDGMNEFIGGSLERTRHGFNPRFVYTAGVQRMAELAGAYWFLDLVALKLAPLYSKAWLAGKTGIGIVTLDVPERGASQAPAPLTVGAALDHKEQKGGPRPATVVKLSLADDEPPAYQERILVTDFPSGVWTFYLGTDEAGPDDYFTTMCLPQEY